MDTPSTSTPLKSTSVVLQGKGNTNNPILFLLPDGSGAAGSFRDLPTLHPSLAVIALNSPFQRRPSDFNVPLPTIAASFVREILRHQPPGQRPYFLGGWSIGGNYAFEAASQLVAMGETVAGLILIDSPCAATYPPLPDPAFDFYERIGIFKNGRLTLKLKKHFSGSMHSLKDYKPNSLDLFSNGMSPICVTIWAKEGFWVTVGPEEEAKYRPELEGMESNKCRDWMLNPRESFHGDGWDTLLPMVDVKVVDGNHFSIMKPPNVEGVADAMKPVIERVLDFLRANE